MEFTLSNKPVYTKPKFDTMTGEQRVLFSGLDCLPGQLDLFPTDGAPDETIREVSPEVAQRSHWPAASDDAA